MSHARSVRKWMLSGCILLAATGVAAQENVRLVDEGRIGQAWQLAAGTDVVAPGYPSAMVGRGGSVCMAMGYLIAQDGTTSDFVVLKRWSSLEKADRIPGYWDDFGRAAANAISQWRFAPRADSVGPTATFTVATMTFDGEQVKRPALRAKCAVTDIADAVDTARHEAYERGSIERHELDRLYLNAAKREMRVNQANRCRTSHGYVENCMD